MKRVMEKRFSNMDKWVVAITFLMFSIPFLAQQLVSGFFQPQHYFAFHLILEMLILLYAFNTSFQAWTQFPHTRSHQQLWMGALFFFIGFLELFQANTYNGMPLFDPGAATDQPAWFFMLSRLAQAFGLLMILVPNEKPADRRNRWYAYSLALVSLMIWCLLILSPSHPLPSLFVAGEGSTTLRTSLHVVAMLTQISCVLVLFRKRVLLPDHALLLISSIYMIIGDAIFIKHPDVFAFSTAAGHLFQMAGFYFFVRSFSLSWAEEPFQKQKAAEDLLRQREDFLHTLVSHMQEGIIVTDTQDKLTYCNAKTELMLRWSANELMGKNLHELLLQHHHDRDRCPYEECTGLPISCYQQLSRQKGDYFVRKDGTSFPVSLTMTPILEADQQVGSILVFVDITQQKKDQEFISYMAYHDELTKLPNARHVAERIAELISMDTAKQHAVILLDIDRFKTMNESLGHALGDRILESVSLRLRESLPARLFVGRLRGNQFAILLPDFRNRDEIVKLCQQIQSIQNEPYLIQHFLLKVTLNIGIALYPKHGENDQELCKQAQIAMKEAQKNHAATPFTILIWTRNYSSA